jgi:hypothetical protein
MKEKKWSTFKFNSGQKACDPARTQNYFNVALCHRLLTRLVVSSVGTSFPVDSEGEENLDIANHPPTLTHCHCRSFYAQVLMFLGTPYRSPSDWPAHLRLKKNNKNNDDAGRPASVALLK